MTNNPPFEDITRVGLQAINLAGSIFRQSNQIKIIASKSHQQDIVTQTDLDMEQSILDIIKSHFPNHGFNSEETGQINPQAEYIWIIDPLDGTKNLKRGIPLISTSLCCQYQGETTFAAVAIHTWKTTIHGTKDRGIYKNGQPAQISSTTDLKNAFIYAELPSPWAKQPVSLKQINYHLNIFKKLTLASYRIRSFGSGPIGLALTAIGAFDAYINLYSGSDPGDIEPGRFLVEEAGGITSDLRGQPYNPPPTNLLAANPHLYPQMINLLNRYYTKGLKPLSPHPSIQKLQ